MGNQIDRPATSTPEPEQSDSARREQEVRILALQLACNDKYDYDTTHVVDRARAYADFITGTLTAEIIDGVKRLAEKAA